MRPFTLLAFVACFFSPEPLRADFLTFRDLSSGNLVAVSGPVLDFAFPGPAGSVSIQTDMALPVADPTDPRYLADYVHITSNGGVAYYNIFFLEPQYHTLLCTSVTEGFPCPFTQDQVPDIRIDFFQSPTGPIVASYIVSLQIVPEPSSVFLLLFPAALSMGGMAVSARIRTRQIPPNKPTRDA
jgi:hypothetical protein